MSTQGSSQLAFGKAAAKFNVAESDYLVMASSKIGSFSELAFRFPRAEDFESYMVRILRTRGAYRSGETIRVYDIATPVPREDYKESDDAAWLRRLWTLAAKVAKSEVEALAGDGRVHSEGQKDADAPGRQGEAFALDLDKSSTELRLEWGPQTSDLGILCFHGQREQTQEVRKAAKGLARVGDQWQSRYPPGG